MTQIAQPHRRLDEPVLSPHTAKRLVHSFARSTDAESSSSGSPDSLYSNSSPTFLDQSFEFDEQLNEVEADYESLADGDEWTSPAWGAWPEMGAAESRSWTSRGSLSMRGSIISLSPGGSGTGSRKGSLAGKLRSEDSRRHSNPSLLGFELGQRRSSVKSLNGLPVRRRSSVLSNMSLDPLESARLRNIASMDQLGRRFSEAIEIAQPEGDDLDVGHAMLARRAISQWSPYSSSMGDDDDYSEVHTAPYVPTPPIPRAPALMLSNFPLASVATEPESMDDTAASTPASPGRRQSSTRLPVLIPATTASQRFFATPPPPTQPSRLLRERTRPSLNRAMTEYQFPPREVVSIPTGSFQPPALTRSISTPFFSASAQDKTTQRNMELRAQGSFPLQRTALGVSPLRASLRRQSVVSDGASRRGSIVESRRNSETDYRRASADRRLSSARDDLRRASMDRRMSMSTDGRRISDVRRVSDVRRNSLEPRRSIEMRRTSEDLLRKQSLDIRNLRSRQSSLAASIDSRVTPSSVTSRKSSVVSIGEYGYLAPQIVIDTVKTPVIEESSGTIMEALETPQAEPSRRSRAPASIVLPAYTFPQVSPPATATPTPRYNPLDSFFGRDPISTAAISSFPVDPLTPLGETASQTPLLHTPKGSGVLDRPRPISPPEFDTDGILPRWKGPTSPKSLMSLKSPTLSLAATSPETVHTALSHTPVPAPISVESSETEESRPELRHTRSANFRKAVPLLSKEEMKKEEQQEGVLRAKRSAEQLSRSQTPTSPIPRERRGAVSSEVITPKTLRNEILDTTAVMKEVARSPRTKAHPQAQVHTPMQSPTQKHTPRQPHRRTISTASSTTPSTPSPRPANRRTRTLPPVEPILLHPIINPVPSPAPMSPPEGMRRSHVVFDLPAWRSPVMMMPDSSPELLASTTSMSMPLSSPSMSISTSTSATSKSTRSVDTVPVPAPVPLPAPVSEKREIFGILSKRSSAIFSPGIAAEFSHQPSSQSQASLAPARPSMGRASSFTRFFHKSKAASVSITATSVSSPMAVAAASASGGSRPLSMDEQAIGRLGIPRS